MRTRKNTKKTVTLHVISDEKKQIIFFTERIKYRFISFIYLIIN
jgi:hypothetical protein